MSNITIFDNAQFGSVRIAEREGDLWFVAKDVCEALELDNVTEALRGLDDDEKTTVINPEGNPRAGIPHQFNIISEPGLYSLVLRSRKPEARLFKRWITHEVIPSIRKRGLYGTPQTVEAMLADPDTTIRILTELKTERVHRAALEAQAQLDRPKVIFADAVDASASSILIGDFAKLLRQNGVEMGQNRLFNWLRHSGYLMTKGESRNMPTQRSMELGLFEIKERTINNPDGSIRVTKTTKMTGKGQVYFINKFLDEKSRIMEAAI